MGWLYPPPPPPVCCANAGRALPSCFCLVFKGGKAAAIAGGRRPTPLRNYLKAGGGPTGALQPSPVKQEPVFKRLVLVGSSYRFAKAGPGPLLLLCKRKERKRKERKREREKEGCPTYYLLFDPYFSLALLCVALGSLAYWLCANPCCFAAKQGIAKGEALFIIIAQGRTLPLRILALR